MPDIDEAAALKFEDVEIVESPAPVSTSEAGEAFMAADGEIEDPFIPDPFLPDYKDHDKESNEGGNAFESAVSLGETSEPKHDSKSDNLANTVRRQELRRALNDLRDSVHPTPLLTGLKDHPSMFIRLGEPPLECNLALQDHWHRAFELCSKASAVYKKLLRKSGFRYFLKIKPFKISSGGYMSALMERYFPETHTIHLSTFELGPTPLDWHMITGLFFGGDPLTPDDITPEECVKLLGFESTEGIIVNNKLKLEALCPSTLDFSKNPKKSDLEWMFRQLIVYLVGSCFFSDSDMMVPIRLVSAMANVRDINRFDWAAATFSAFLRGMRQTTSECCGSYSGFYPFLLLWAYEYIPHMRPSTLPDDFIYPVARRWNMTNMNVPNSRKFNDCIWYRLELEYVEADEVNFDPYKAWDGVAFNDAIKLSLRRVPFIGLETWELYMGERNLRQFGCEIRIPISPPVERHGEIHKDLETYLDYPLEGFDATSLHKDEKCDYAEWFRDNSLGRIVDNYHASSSIGGNVINILLKVDRN